MNLPRQLDAIEVRVLGCLLEKQQLTPEYYPLTVNALVAACNQLSSREPVMHVTEAEVGAALDRLAEHVLVWRSAGSRVDRWAHNLDRRLQLDAPAKAIVTLLFLRGPQTPGELRTHTDRLCKFGGLDEVEATLKRLMARDDGPFVAKLPREPGKRESRYTHLYCGEVQVPATPEGGEATAGVSGAGGDRFDRLESLIGELRREIDEIKIKLERINS